MIVTKTGSRPQGEFFFRCGCGTEWYAERREVNFTPPCMEYGVYMKCPCCGNRYVFSTKPSGNKEDTDE